MQAVSAALARRSAFCRVVEERAALGDWLQGASARRPSARQFWAAVKRALAGSTKFNNRTSVEAKLRCALAAATALGLSAIRMAKRAMRFTSSRTRTWGVAGKTSQ